MLAYFLAAGGVGAKTVRSGGEGRATEVGSGAAGDGAGEVALGGIEDSVG